MDAYLSSIEKYLATNVVLNYGDRRAQSSETNIIIDAELAGSCPAEAELINAMTKRFSSRLSSPYRDKLMCVFLVCLLSDGYTVTTRSFTNVTNNDICSTWSVIECLSVSSSPPLAKWILLCLAGRSRRGYHASTPSTDAVREVKSYVPPLVPKPVGKVVELMPKVAAHIWGPADTIVNAAATDLEMLMSLRALVGKQPIQTQAVLDGSPELVATE